MTNPDFYMMKAIRDVLAIAEEGNEDVLQTLTRVYGFSEEKLINVALVFSEQIGSAMKPQDENDVAVISTPHFMALMSVMFSAGMLVGLKTGGYLVEEQ